jgi:hypothetical protein
VQAIAARDLDRIVGALAPDTGLRYLIPPGPGHIVGAAAAAAKFLQWFGDADVLRVQSVRVEALADRISARYRFLLHQQEGWEVIEQQLYLDVDEQGRVTAIDLLCSGFRPTGGAEAVRSSGTHQFDAGTMGAPTDWPRSSAAEFWPSRWGTSWWSKPRTRRRSRISRPLPG